MSHSCCKLASRDSWVLSFWRILLRESIRLIAGWYCGSAWLEWPLWVLQAGNSAGIGSQSTSPGSLCHRRIQDHHQSWLTSWRQRISHFTYFMYGTLWYGVRTQCFRHFSYISLSLSITWFLFLNCRQPKPLTLMWRFWRGSAIGDGCIANDLLSRRSTKATTRWFGHRHDQKLRWRRVR